MTVQSDPLIRLVVLSAAMERSEQLIYREILRGALPPHDALTPLRHSHARTWKLSTLRAWNPTVAARCAAILAALETVPLKVA